MEDRPIDILFLVERLESLIADGKRLPLTSNVVVDQEAALDLVDQLRVAVPEEIRAAKQINSQGSRILEKAEDEAQQTLARAQEHAALLIQERGLTEEAQRVAARIIADAETAAGEIRRGADEYAASVLIKLEGNLVTTLNSVKRGIELLDERRAALVPPSAAEVVEAEGLEIDEDEIDDEDAPTGEGEDEPRRGWR